MLKAEAGEGGTAFPVVSSPRGSARSAAVIRSSAGASAVSSWAKRAVEDRQNKHKMAMAAKRRDTPADNFSFSLPVQLIISNYSLFKKK
jgi:hypothetical protein